MFDNFDKNLEKAAIALRRYQGNPLPHFINGAMTCGLKGDSFDNLNPVDNTVLTTVARGGAPEIDAACTAATQAFMDWQHTSGEERGDIMRRLAGLIEKNAEDIILLECADTGQPLRYMQNTAKRAAANFRYFAEKARDISAGLSLPTATHDNITTRQPIGPVAVITPWNTPFMLAAWKIAPALAAGCSIVHKPAEFSPVTALLLAELAQEAGVPKGVWNVVHGFVEEAGKALTVHPAIRAITFVGESATGKDIMAQAATGLKRVHFELGGKNPVMVFDDADLERALDAVLLLIFSLNGQRCTSSSRLLIQQTIADKFQDALIQRIKNIKVGHPLDPQTELGPLIHRTHLDKVLHYIEQGRHAGAMLRTGGHRVAEHAEGNFVAPTLFTEAQSHMSVAQEEIFGPVLTAISFTDDEEALQIANDTKYGLASYIWTADQDRAAYLARRLESGMVWVNSDNIRTLDSPFGGMKESGMGRYGGDYSFDVYMETKHISIARGDYDIPRIGL